MQNYNFIQKLFHDIVLGNKFINKSLFEFEKFFYLKNNDIKNQLHIFISGLPRSGTTSILNFIYSFNQHASLTYKNMPFVLSPNFSNLFNKKNILKKERLHGDGITYDINSPEALDEIFFKNDEKFIKNELLNYLQLILFSTKRFKYLSKNNLNYKRINLINSILPNSIFLIPIREPLQHAYSLLNQHLRFNELQKNDKFILRYMNYLGHNEFGLNHKSWHQPINFHDQNKINYWLEQWFLFYELIFKKYSSHKNCIFVVYEELVNPKYLNILLNKINLDKVKAHNFDYIKNLNKKEININFSDNMYKKTKDLYVTFKDKSLIK